MERVDAAAGRGAIARFLPAGAAANFTPLVLNGALSSNVTFNAANNDYEVVVNLTNSSLGSVSAARPTSSCKARIRPPRRLRHRPHAVDRHRQQRRQHCAQRCGLELYGYARVEFNLQNKSADEGNHARRSRASPSISR